jgi:asparagine synthase (glutamine-hydrolysing)
MIADVPLGAFLSGGADSSTVVALMQAQSNRPVKTFTIGFREEKYDEAVHAKAVAAHLGTDHTELYVTPEEAMAVIPKLPTLFDEPFSDASQIPTYLISALARRQVTVSLSGDGGDELFGGYPWHSLASSAWKGMRWLPLRCRRLMGSLITKWDPRTYDRRLALLSPFLDRYGQPGHVGEKLHKIAELLLAESPEEVYQNFASHWKRPTEVVLLSKEAPTIVTNPSQWAVLPEVAQRMMFLDLVTYLSDDILVKLDRASMGVSLEARVPLLDHRVVEFAARLPLSFKIRNGQRKWLLRNVLYQYVPRATVDRPKMGFSVPIGIWLRGPLREWAEDLLSEDRLRHEGYFNPEAIRRRWADCVSGHQNLQYPLWSVLMFQAWRAQWESSSA